MSLRCRHLVCELTFGSLFCDTPTSLFMTGWTQQNIKKRYMMQQRFDINLRAKSNYSLMGNPTSYRLCE